MLRYAYTYMHYYPYSFPSGLSQDIDYSSRAMQEALAVYPFDTSSHLLISNPHSTPAPPRGQVPAIHSHPPTLQF